MQGGLRGCKEGEGCRHSPALAPQDPAFAGSPQSLSLRKGVCGGRTMLLALAEHWDITKSTSADPAWDRGLSLADEAQDVKVPLNLGRSSAQ